MNTLQQIIAIASSVLSLIVTLGVVICTTIPGIRKKIVDSVLKDQKVDNIADELREVKEILKAQQEERKDLQKELELSKEADICLVRDRITRIYYKNMNKKTIKAYDMENLTQLFELYEKLGGNHYVQTIYKTITENWEVIQ